MMRSWRISIALGLGAVLAMVLGGFLALRLCPTMDEPDLPQGVLRPATLETAAALDAELVVVSEEIQKLAPSIEAEAVRKIEYFTHLKNAVESQMVGLVATTLIRYYLDRDATTEAAMQQLTANVSIRAARAHLELARLLERE